MRIWSIHPSYLDAKGLVAAWREGLLAQKVLMGGTIGYKNHPQLDRFKASANSRATIANYLHELFLESCRRGYSFDASKILAFDQGSSEKIGVNAGQLRYEFELLKRKLATRDTNKLEELNAVVRILANDSFLEREGGIEAWEKIQTVQG